MAQLLQNPSNENRNRMEKSEENGFSQDEESYTVVEPSQVYGEPGGIVVDDIEQKRIKRYAGILSDEQLKELIGINKTTSKESLGLQYEEPKYTFFGNLEVSLFWEEKIMILIWALQLLGFFYVVLIEYVPKRYIGLGRFFAIFLLKFDYIASYNSAISNYNFIFVYSLLWSIIGIGYFAVLFGLHIKGCFHRGSISGPYWFFKLLYYSFESLAFPILMNTLPNTICQLRTDDIDIEVVNCWEKNGHVILLIFAAFALVGIVIMMIGVWLTAKSNYVYSSNVHHENYLKIKELEFVFGLSYMWKSNWFFLFSSFKREGWTLYHRPIRYLYIIILVILYSILNKSVNTSFYVLVIIIVCFNIYITVKPPYRCTTTNLLYMIMMWGFLPTFAILYMRTTNVRNALIVVDKNFVQLLITLTVFTISIFIMLCALYIVLKIKWVIDPKIVEEVTTHPKLVSMLVHLKEAKQKTIELAKRRKFYFVDKEDYKNILAYLEHDFTEANKLKHFFKDIILEFMEELYQYYDKVINESLLPHKRLANYLGPIRRILLNRAREQILINPRRQKVLLHLLSFRMLYEQYWAGKETAEMMEQYEKPAKLLNLDEVKFTKGEGHIDERHQFHTLNVE